MDKHSISGKLEDLHPIHALTLSLMIAEGSGHEIQPWDLWGLGVTMNCGDCPTTCIYTRSFIYMLLFKIPRWIAEIYSKNVLWQMDGETDGETDRWTTQAETVYLSYSPILRQRHNFLNTG